MKILSVFITHAHDFPNLGV